MVLLNRLTAFFSALLLVLLLGCASPPTPGGTGEPTDDSVITARVKEAILEEPSLNPEEIGVETIQGAVRLTGFVSSIIVMEKAIEVARGVKGVRSVKDEMRLKWQH
ncbi:BON domain-containing protein [Nitrosospira lacus]|uniref:Transporter n=1 Tax=Nitrosospira lacus TaxID=1288494 RepID=A0A1W6SQU4_9PROT|nr:BON domain-containing protein [Nitrosospira lacus]ARO88194.1 BON domain-containing protein [Nitrosospira lacus]